MQGERKAMNILVVDDEEAHRKLLGNFLQVEG